MFEVVRSTHRSDRVLHTVARLAHVVVAVLVFPLWLLGGKVEVLVGSLLTRVRLGSIHIPSDESGVGKREPRQPDPSATENGNASANGRLTIDELLVDLKQFPQRPRRMGRHATVLKGLPDLSLFMLAQRRETANFGYAYPSQFDHRVLRGADGEPIAATVAMQPKPSPGLVVVHGLFSSRLFDYVRQIAVRAYFEWGFSVAAIDLRSFGHTGAISEAPSSAGWKEGEDIVAAALELKRLGATSVGTLGMSLGASAVMGALQAEGVEQALGGGVLAACGPADTRVAVKYLSDPVPSGHPFKLGQIVFNRMLGIKQQSLEWPTTAENFATPVRDYMAPWYGIDEDEFYTRSSAKNFIGEATVPTLVLHAEDDEIVPVEHAHMLDLAARDNPNVAVWVLSWGGHGAFDVLDRRWTYSVYRRFFENWADWGEQPQNGASQSKDGSTLVYSAQS